MSPAEQARLRRIQELMQFDPPADSAAGQELNRLIDEQLQAEKHIEILPPGFTPDPNWTPDE